MRKLSLGHRPLPGDLSWTPRSTVEYPLVTVVAGVTAGLLGIGGGMVLAPLLVALGCDAAATAATSAFMVLINDTSGLVQVVLVLLLLVLANWT